MDALFERTAILVCPEGIERLKNARILIAGLGGVGSYAVEALARSGIGYIKMIDHDVVSGSNMNRQLVALNSTIGKRKADVMAERVKDINPNCQIEICNDFIKVEDMDALFTEPYDYVIDAIDSLVCKVAYLRTAHEKGYKVISSMGAGGKLDPTQIKVADLYKTNVCKLAFKIRNRLRRQGVPKGIKAVYSTEKPLPPLPPEPVPGNSRPRAVNGTISYLPALFGFTIAGEVIKDLICSIVEHNNPNDFSFNL